MNVLQTLQQLKRRFLSRRTMRTGEGRAEHRLVQFVLAAALLLSLLPGRALAAQLPSVQPALLQAATERPGQAVRVVVQYAGPAEDMSRLASRLGGEVVQDLSILRAFAVRLPAGRVPALGRAENVRWVSMDAEVERSSAPARPAVDAGNTYLETLGVKDVWQQGIDGRGITVAVVDSGIAVTKDFTGKGGKRILERIPFNDNVNVNDSRGHGTHVAGIIGGSGAYVDGAYAGIAPGVNLVGLNISNSEGMAYESDAVAALQWVLEHKETHNIRVVNLSVNATTEMSYHESPLNAALEILWFNGIVVVASAGNGEVGLPYNTVRAAPANDPFIITVGATDEAGTAAIADDAVAHFSASGTTLDGFAKPELVAPGRDIYSVLAPNSDWGRLHPDRVDSQGKYFRASGTSMSAPMVSGAVALLLQAEPHLTPDQVKHRLLQTGNTIQAVRTAADGAQTSYSVPYLNVHNAVNNVTTGTANTGIAASQLLWTGPEPITWDSVSWNSVSWNSVSWNSVSWNSVSWNSVSWNSLSWSSVHWN